MAGGVMGLNPSFARTASLMTQANFHALTRAVLKPKLPKANPNPKRRDVDCCVWVDHRDW